MRWWFSVLFLLLMTGFVAPAADSEKAAEKPAKSAEKTDATKGEKKTDEAEPDAEEDVEKQVKEKKPFVRKEIPFPDSITNVYVIPVKDVIDKPITYIIRRGVKEAMAADADLIILDVDTPGGRVDITEDIIDIIEKFDGPVVTYVNRNAASAGAFISVATERIYMHTRGTIGAAAPVMGGGQEIPETMNEKVKSFLTAKIRNLAESNGHNPDVIEAMIRMESELVIDGEVICPEGQLLSLGAKDAERAYGDPPQYLLSSGTVSDMDELLEKLGAKGVKPVEVEVTGAEQLAGWINAIAPILMMIGIAGLYIEYKTPGFGVFGTIGIVAFLIYFFGGYVAGMSGIEWLVIFFFGVVLIAVELFVFPGTVFIGLGGIALILISLVMAGVDMYPDMPVVPNFDTVGDSLHQSMQNMFVGFLGGILVCWGLSKWLPHTPYYGLMVSQSVSGATSVAAIEEEKASRVGEVGETISQLRPGGKARFDDDILDVISTGEIVEAGERVKIVSHSGSDPVVEPV